LQALFRSSNDNFVWMIGPERGKPVGAFYSADGNMNPTGFASSKTCFLFILILIMRTWWCMKIDKLTSALQNPKIGTPASTKDFEARRILGFPRRKNTFASR
jgi:fumarate reductase subunit D